MIRRTLFARSECVDSYEIFCRLSSCMVCEMSLGCEQVDGIPGGGERASYRGRMSVTLRGYRSLIFSENRFGAIDPVGLTDIIFDVCATTISDARVASRAGQNQASTRCGTL